MRLTGRRADPGDGRAVMTPPCPHFKELQRLLDALCEEAITAGQMRRLEELLLGQPEAEAFYVQYIGMHADLASLGGRPRWLRSGSDGGAEPNPLRPRSRPN